MNALVALVAVVVLALIAFLGVSAGGLALVFGVVVPYVALAIFVAGVVWRVLKWGRVPVPFRIPTTCGQQKSLPWIRHDKLESPFTTGQVILRMALEVLLFRSLFRNTKAELTKDRRLAYGSEKLLWLAGLAFHWTFLIVLVRHLRFFTQPVPGIVKLADHLDSFFKIGLPAVYMTGAILLAAVTVLFLRRVLIPQVRYISLVSDYFPLFLIMGIVVTGGTLRYFAHTDVEAVKELTMGLAGFAPTIPKAPISPWFYAHLFLVSVLFAYFPWSKLMHMAGVFLSPTRNLANNSRARHHENPWNYPVKVHTYEEYEEEFGERMVAAGIPTDKPHARKE